MAMFDELGGLVASGPNLSRIASSIGASDDATRTAISAGVPILLAGLDRHARNFTGARAVFDLVQSDDGSVLTDIAGHVSRADSDGRGSTLVDAILGGRRSMIEQTISSSTELGIGPISHLLTTMAPLVVGIVGRKQTAQNLDQSSVVSALAADRAEMESIGYGSWLGLLDGGDDDADTQNFVANADRITATGGAATPASPLSPPRVVADPAPGTPAAGQPPSALTAEVPPAAQPTGAGTAPLAGTAPSAFEATPTTPEPAGGISGVAKAGAVGAAGLGAAAAGAAASGMDATKKAANPAEAAGADAAARFRSGAKTPSVGDVGSTISSPSTPGRPDLPGRPNVPGGPDLPGGPNVPGGPDLPGRPNVPGGPDLPGRPNVPGGPDRPAMPGSPTMPTAPDSPKITIDDGSAPTVGGATLPGTKIESSNYSIGTKTEPKRGGGWLKWLLPLALLILFGFLLRQCLSSETDEVVAPEATLVPTEVAETPTPAPTPEPTVEPTAVPTPEPEPDAGPELGNYVDGQLLSTAYESGNFDTLLNGLEVTALRDTLEEGGPFTVFAPTDDAFNALPESLREDLDENPELLSQVLLYHVVPGSLAAADLAPGTIGAFDGQNLFIDVGEDNTAINGSTVTAADISASNGIAHAIDQVLIPPSLFGASRMTLNTVLGLDQITFETGSASITSEGELVLEKAFAYLANSDARLAIGGHTDNVGSEAVNLELSQKRAESVMQSLVERGIDPSRLRAIGYGASQPVADNESDDGRALNRRIELTAS